ncbi:MAG TPA: histidine triad nucleotide-binding protein [Gemmatimonadales bacterium]|jgi:histidine triad (HIT) family protein
MTDCIFCRIGSGEIPAKLAAKGDGVLAFYDLNPQAPVHLLVIPTRHLSGANAVTALDRIVWSQVMSLAIQVAREQGIADSGYRLVVNQGRDGGQSVEHLHVHVLGGRRMAWPPG